MRIRDKILPISLLTLALAAPGVLPGPSLAEASIADQGNKDKNRDKGREQENRDHGWDDDDDWDDDRDGNMRFQGMDTNGDGRVTRSEWRGNNQSFQNHDTNRDGVLSGAEVRPGGRRDRDEDDLENRFDRLDRNNDGYLSLSEWGRDRDRFDRLDLNNDNRLSRNEILDQDWDRDDNRHERREDRFEDLDDNNDGRLTRSEWWGGREAFERMDRNNDGYLSRSEFLNRDRDRARDREWDDTDRRDDRRFRELDANRDGRMTRSEWPGTSDSFARLDRNNDGLSLNEWLSR